MVFEPYVGGHIIDRGTDGSECAWATVLAWEPPTRVCFSWNINLQWQIEPDPQRASEIEISFNADLDTTRRIMDADPGVRASIFRAELHPVRGVPGSRLQ